MEKVKLGVIGIGMRGENHLECIGFCDEAEVVAVCDAYEDRVEKGVSLVQKHKGNTPTAYLDYKLLLQDKNVDAVLISTGWKQHVSIAIDAMNAGIPVAMEVGAAFSIAECEALVEKYERTRTPFMLLENCCYDMNELLATSLVRAGKFGEVVYCHGAYAHDIRGEIAKGNINRHYRLEEYLHHNCDNYPTHDLGPIAKILDINRGNRMVSLVSMSSKSVGLKHYIASRKVEDPALNGVEFMQGDVVTTMIKCENGETITLTLDTTTPRFYSREFTVKGTKGMFSEDGKRVHIDQAQHIPNIAHNTHMYMSYLPDEWKNNLDDRISHVGHGLMDVLVLKAFFNALITGAEMPIDVYDAAAWISISAISEKSIAEGSTPQQIPDFTRGAYKTRPRKDVLQFPVVKQ